MVSRGAFADGPMTSYSPDDLPKTTYPGIPLDRREAAQQKYLEQRRLGKSVLASAEIAGVHRDTIYHWRNTDAVFAAEEVREWHAGREARARRRVDSVDLVEFAGRKIITRQVARGERDPASWDQIVQDEGEQRMLALGKSMIVDAVKVGVQIEGAGVETDLPLKAEIVRQAAPVSNIGDFLERDLGPEVLPIASLWPRVELIVRLADRPDIRTVILEIGKGSGKSIIAALIGTRMLQRLVAAPDPASALGVLPGQPVGILNVSVTGNQAQLSIFASLANYVSKSPWFASYAKPVVLADRIDLPRGVLAFSGNSSSRGVEGVNWVCVLADELDRLSEDVNLTSSQARDLVEPVEATLVTRFPRDRKTVLMSWPESRSSYIRRRVEAVRASGVIEDLTPAFLATPVHRDVPEVETERRRRAALEPFRDYRPEVFVARGGVLVVRGPIWEFSPRVDFDELAEAFRTSEYQAARMYGAMPLASGAAPVFRALDEFKRKADASLKNPILPNGRLDPEFKGDPTQWYYGHLDLGVRHDAAGIALAHYDNGHVVFDLLLEIKPPDGGEIRIASLLQIVADLVARGFTLAEFTHDGYQGIAVEQGFASLGVESKLFSVDRDRRAYDTMVEAWYANRLRYYPYEPLFKNIEALVDTGRKIDHVPGGAKDVVDAMAAACFHVLSAVVMD